MMIDAPFGDSGVLILPTCQHEKKDPGGGETNDMVMEEERQGVGERSGG